MAANTGFLNVSQLDFSSLKENFKTYLKGQDKYKDFDFEGSNLSVLLDILAYNSYLNAFYLNQIGSEQFLDTAQLKESVVSHAKELNYLPRSRKSSEAQVTIQINGLGSPSTITIPKGYQFQTSLNNTNYTFSTQENIVVTPNNGIYEAANVTIYEGFSVTEFFRVSDNQNIFRLESSDNIDLSTLTVTVIQSENNTAANTVWERATSLFGLTSESNTYFVEGTSANKYQLAFSRDNIFGRKLTNGNVVKAEYLSCSGNTTNGVFAFSPKTTINGRSVTVSTLRRAEFGSERESINEIKFNAPRFFQTQERAVIASDFETIVRSEFPEIQSVLAYGGEEATPPEYGKVILVVKPFGTEFFVPDSLKQRIVNSLKLKSMTTEPLIIDPETYYAEINSTVFYDRSALNGISVSELRTKVVNNILALNNTTLNTFNADLRTSRLISIIDQTDPTIVSNDTSLRIIRRWVPIVNFNENLQFSFGNAIKNLVVPGSQEQPLGHPPMLDSTPFVFTSDDGIDYTVRMQDNGRGTIFIYTTQNDGTITVIKDNIGTIDYDTGFINITLAVKGYDGNYISIYGRTRNRDLIANQNRFLIISSNDLSVTMREALD